MFTQILVVALFIAAAAVAAAALHRASDKIDNTASRLRALVYGFSGALALMALAQGLRILLVILQNG